MSRTKINVKGEVYSKQYNVVYEFVERNMALMVTWLGPTLTNAPRCRRVAQYIPRSCLQLSGVLFFFFFFFICQDYWYFECTMNTFPLPILRFLRQFSYKTFILFFYQIWGMNVEKGSQVFIKTDWYQKWLPHQLIILANALIY